MKIFKHSSQIRWLFFLILIFVSEDNIIMAQNNYTLVDSLSRQYFIERNWTAMQLLFNEHHPDFFQSNVFYQRNAAAEFQLGNIYKAEKLISKSLSLNKYDMFSLGLMHDVLLQKGQIDKAISIGKSHLGYKKNVWLSSIAAETGLKYSALQEPEDLWHIGLGVRSRIGYRFNLNQFFSINKQHYFWEQFEQLNYTALPEYHLNKNWSIEAPFQIADYNSKIDYQDSSEISQRFDADGLASQQAQHFGFNLKYLKLRHKMMLGFSNFSSLTKAAYQLNFNNQDTIVNQIFDTTGRFAQQQINLEYQYTLPILKNSIRVGSYVYLIESQFGQFINFRPYLSISATKNLLLFFDYWHKDRYMLASPVKGIMINNFNTQTQRVLASVQYFPIPQLSVELSYINEFGKDLLYNNSLQYQGVFLNIAYTLKP